MTTEYHFWTLFVRNGRTYADRHRYVTPHDARAAHANAARFEWAPDDAGARIVTELYATSVAGKEIAIAPEVRAAQQELR